MANKTLSELTEITDLSPSHVVAVDTGTQTFKMRADNLATALKKNSSRQFLSTRGTYTVAAGVTRLRVTAVERTSGKVYNCGAVLIQKSDGTLLGTGDNSSGQLGDGTAVKRSSPVTQAGGGVWQPLRWPGYIGDKSVFLRPDGTAFATGVNGSGELGLGDTANRSSPTSVAAVNRFKEIGPSFYQTTLLRNIHGDWFAMGQNSSGELGDGTNVAKSIPTRILAPVNFEKITWGGASISTAYVGLTADGIAYAWGYNASGQLGDGTVAAKSSPVAVAGNYRFHRIVGSSDNNGRFIGLTRDGRLFAWGNNTSGQLGDGTETDRSSPVQVAGGALAYIWHEIRNGGGMAIDCNNNLWTWGSSQYGGLGINLGGLASVSSPVGVYGGHKFRKAWDFNESTFAVDLDGNLYSWGQNFYGRLGQGTTGVHGSSPVLVLMPEPTEEVFNVFNTMFARGVSGAMYGWGRNESGELGLGNRTAFSSPVAVFGGFVDSDPSYIELDSRVIPVTAGQQLVYACTAYAFQFGPLSFPDCEMLVVEVNGA